MLDVEGYSRALYSNWFWHKPAQLIVDAGEGLHLRLRAGVWQPNIVALTHGHSDHVLGLAGFAGARRFGKGATTKPWTVLYPAQSRGVEAVREFIAHVWRGVEFPVVWHEMTTGSRFRVSQHRSIEAFAVQHVPGEHTLGYRLIEQRRRLKPEFSDRTTADVEQLARRLGRAAVMDEYEHVSFVHSGDAMAIDVNLARGADLLVHDATFLAAEERREPIHATTDEVFALAREAGVARLVVNHLSVRYERGKALARMHEQLAASGFDGDCWLLDEDALLPLGRARA